MTVGEPDAGLRSETDPTYPVVRLLIFIHEGDSNKMIMMTVFPAQKFSMLRHVDWSLLPHLKGLFDWSGYGPSRIIEVGVRTTCRHCIIVD